MKRRMVLRVGATVLIALTMAACNGGLLLANPPLVRPAPPTPQATPPASRPPDPVAIAFPRDDGPHDRLTEWWYYTGHLRAQDGRRFGFEAVVFRAERGDVPVTWASHLALTDETGQRFLYAQRSEIGPGADHSPRDASGVPTGFDLRVVGFDPADPSTAASPPWQLVGTGGRDDIQAALTPAEGAAAGGGFGLDLSLVTVKAPALHDVIGWVPFGAAGGSYYYSRTELSVGGTLTLDGTAERISGEAWFDHQWGDFISVGGGGWDWFAVNLDDGTDLTLSMVRGADGTVALSYGTLVSPSGVVSHLDPATFSVTPKGTWTSPRTGATYPAGWQLNVGERQLSIALTPTVADQELDTRPTTGVVYWEGSQQVSATVDGRPVGGEGYVELTGYAPKP